jgi:hypothetical protein
MSLTQPTAPTFKQPKSSESDHALALAVALMGDDRAAQASLAMPYRAAQAKAERENQRMLDQFRIDQAAFQQDLKSAQQELMAQENAYDRSMKAAQEHQRSERASLLSRATSTRDQANKLEREIDELRDEYEKSGTASRLTELGHRLGKSEAEIAERIELANQSQSYKKLQNQQKARELWTEMVDASLLPDGTVSELAKQNLERHRLELEKMGGIKLTPPVSDISFWDANTQTILRAKKIYMEREYGVKMGAQEMEALASLHRTNTLKSRVALYEGALDNAKPERRAQIRFNLSRIKLELETEINLLERLTKSGQAKVRQAIAGQKPDANQLSLARVWDDLRQMVTAKPKLPTQVAPLDPLGPNVRLQPLSPQSTLPPATTSGTNLSGPIRY